MDKVQIEVGVEADVRSAQRNHELDNGTSHVRSQQLDQNKHLIEKQAEEICNLHGSIQQEGERELAAKEAEKNRSVELTREEIKSDLEHQQKMSMLNLAIHQCIEERESRKHINDKILEVNSFVADLDEQFLKANRILSAPAEDYKSMTPRQKKAAQTNLIMFKEILKSITSKLEDIEQYLASLECEDVDHVTKISREIKTKIRSFYQLIANLILILCIGDIDIDPAMTEAFAKAKETLFEQINEMTPIPENRSRIVEAIQQRQEETMPNVTADQDGPSS